MLDGWWGKEYWEGVSFLKIWVRNILDWRSYKFIGVGLVVRMLFLRIRKLFYVIEFSE